MNTQVTTIPPESVDPEVRVHLDLSVAEFAMFANLVFCHLGGNSVLRNDISEGIVEAIASLPEPVRALAHKAQTLSKGTAGWNSENVEAVFS